MTVDEKRALQGIALGDEDALVWAMDRYGPYVSAVVYNILRGAVAPEDRDEVCADVFFTLWTSGRKIRPGKLKAWLGGVTRNLARKRLRSVGGELPLEEDVLILSDSDPVRRMEDREQAAFLHQALLAMGQPDREIFLRRYYYCQPLSQIAEQMRMNLSTVKTRLHRGRRKLKEVLQKGGYDVEDQDI